MSGLALRRAQPWRRGERLGSRGLVLLGAAAGGRHRAARGTRRAAAAGAEVVVSTAIADDNPELLRARAAGARILHRGDLLGRGQQAQAVDRRGRHPRQDHHRLDDRAGALEAGRDPAFLIGGELRAPGTQRRVGRGRVGGDRGRRVRPLLPEARAATWPWSRASSSTTTPPTARSASWSAPSRSSRRPAGARRARPGRASCRRWCRALSYGIDAGDLRAESPSSCSRWDRASRSADVPVELAVPGRHNVLNALAALAACRCGRCRAGRRRAGARALHRGGAALRGPRHGPRRARGCSTTTRTTRPRCAPRSPPLARRAPARLVACFQPHLYSRTRLLAREFGRALALADLVVVLDVYPARERAEDFPGVSGLLVAGAAADAARAAARCGGCRASTTPSASCARSSARATCC